jgi:hypothetical protein
MHMMLCDLRIHVGPPVGFDESPSWTRHLVLLLLVGGGGGEEEGQAKMLVLGDGEGSFGRIELELDLSACLLGGRPRPV